MVHFGTYHVYPGMERDIIISLFQVKDVVNKKCQCISQKKSRHIPQSKLGLTNSSVTLDIIIINFLRVDRCSLGCEYILCTTYLVCAKHMLPTLCLMKLLQKCYSMIWSFWWDTPSSCEIWKKIIQRVTRNTEV